MCGIGATQSKGIIGQGRSSPDALTYPSVWVSVSTMSACLKGKLVINRTKQFRVPLQNGGVLMACLQNLGLERDFQRSP